MIFLVYKRLEPLVIKSRCQPFRNGVDRKYTPCRSALWSAFSPYACPASWRENLAAVRVGLRAGAATYTAARIGGVRGVGQLATGATVDSAAYVTRGFRQALTSGRIYGARAAGGGSFPQMELPLQSRRHLRLPQTLVSRVVPPSPPPHGGLNAPLRPPE